MVISKGKKVEFKPYVEIASDVFDFRWGKEDVKEKVGTLVDGEWVLTGEVKDTSLCTYETHRFFKEKPSYSLLTRTYNKGMRIPSMSEMKAHGEFIGMSEDRMLPWMKEQMKRAILKHDSSSAVNSFTIGGIEVWLDKSTRVGLLLRFQSEQAQGKTETTLWHNGNAYPMTIEDGIAMLYTIEGYASACYDQTQKKLVELDDVETVADMLLFDFTSGYPDKLAF